MKEKIEAIFAQAQAAMVEALRNGVAPWSKSWGTVHAHPWNAGTGREYKGLANAFLLMIGAMRVGGGNAWIGWGQAAAKGGKVRPGQEKEYTWILAPMIGKKKNAATGLEEKRLYGFRTVHVYNVSQCEGITIPEPERHDCPPNEIADAIIAGYSERPAILHDGGNSAFYCPLSDSVHLPERERFTSADAYYSTLFHELGHSTGHEKRLARPGIVKGWEKTKHDYSEEELVAEMVAAYLCALAGINSTVEQSAAYIAGWLARLENDGTILHRATMAAQAAAKRIAGAYLAARYAEEPAADEAAA
jgi:antirestriction protein ArdC